MSSSPFSVAMSQIGVKSGKKYWGSGYVDGDATPWCACFITWCFKNSGQLDLIKGIDNKNYVPSWVKWAKRTGKWSQRVKPGAVVVFDWSGSRSGGGSHIGFVVRDLKNGYIETVEGNTSYSSDSNGGQVMRRVRHKSYVLGYIHVGIQNSVHTKVYATGRVYCYGTHGRGKNQVWKIDKRGIYLPSALIENKKKVKSKSYYAEGVVKCYGSNGKGKNEAWQISKIGEAWVNKVYLSNRKSI